MKAAVVVGFNDIQYIDIPDVNVEAGQVKVAVKHCGICGSDIPRVLNGACHSFPQVLGHEFSGIVSEVADGVTSVAVGDHVVGVPLVPCMECEDCKKGNFSLCKHYSFVGSRQQGAMADYVVVPESNVYKIDKNIPLDHAALFEPSTVALHGTMINHYHPTEADHVCIFGAGSIALFTIQWCKILGAKNITAIIRSKDRAGIVKKYGATTVVSTLDEDYLEQIKEITNGKGYDYVFDAAGTGATIQASLQVAANKANVCLIGTPTQPIEFSVKMWELINRKEMYVTGSWMSYSAPWPGVEWQKTAECMATKELVIDNDMIHTHYPLSDVKNAFKEFENNRSAVKGRIMLDIYE
ncbi:MAG: galactitol-1-phosphate 5-dehydrogenase [Segatella copri]